ncbi:unnamed protein product [Mytilus edulis]|uniref:DDE-1 domain-containing protein n=1 Tax=Mytilus edulis TaxID=6550 RepID=A0A8S3QFM1_MYTED|nr:unnamed protein product [Mytilus edulis]
MSKRYQHSMRQIQKAWMTSEIFTNWLIKLEKKYLRQQRKVAMIVDNCPAHPHVKGLKSIKLVFLPPNTTSCSVDIESRVSDQHQEENDDDDDIPLARPAGINFTEHANTDNDIPTTEPLTDDDIINEITSSMKETEEDSVEEDTITIKNPFRACLPWLR